MNGLSTSTRRSANHVVMPPNQRSASGITASGASSVTV
jgi:hypothetical protein